MQAKLLRALQHKEIERVGAGYPIPIDVRIISATNSDLHAAVKEKKFREDLFYRLNVVPLHIPPLRKRKEDIPLLANHFLHKYNHEFGKQIKDISEEAMRILKKYDWPGNVRELENIIERMVVLSKSGHISSELLPADIKAGFFHLAKGTQDITLSSAVQRFEADFIRKTLEAAGGKKGKAAKLLGIHRNTLKNLQKRLNIN
jgi:transcriptional regulator with PAS, ATPase and Fis domain